jgi:hypothetical protein
MNEETSEKEKNDTRAKMLEALAKKQKGGDGGKSNGPSSGSKIGAGKTGGVAPKIHRRKSGSA